MLFFKFDNGLYCTMLSVVMALHHFKQCPLSKSSIFYQSFMKLGNIVEYRDVFFKFNNGPYRTMLIAVMALCL